MFEISGDINKMILGSFEPSIDAQDPYSEVESMVSKVSSLSSDGTTNEKQNSPRPRRASEASTIKDGIRRVVDKIDDKMHEY
jgi:hypothetical protein